MARRIARLYRAAQLRRPVDDPDRIARTYVGSPLVISAWDGPRLVGILRGWTDGAYDGYVCDLAVDPEYQAQGIGRELLRRCVSGSPDVQWVLRASLIAREYYAHLRVGADRERMVLASEATRHFQRPAPDLSWLMFDRDADRRQHANGHGGS